MKRIKKTSKGRQGSRRREVPIDALKAIVERARKGTLSEDDCQVLGEAVDTLAFLTHELEEKGTKVARLRRMLFGPHSERTRDVLGQVGEAPAGRTTRRGAPGKSPSGSRAPRPRPCGHPPPTSGGVARASGAVTVATALAPTPALR